MVRFYVLMFLAVVWGAFGQVVDVKADSFGSGANSFEIEFVTIGNPGNSADLSRGGLGAVAYEYRMGKYEISEQMIEQANALGSLGITKDSRGPDKPATSVTWFEAAQFVNWLNTSTGHMPAYKFDAGGNFQLWQPIDPGYDPNNLFRNERAIYFLPSANEWHKAAYYDLVSSKYFDYPTGNNGAPVAVASGTDANTAVYRQNVSIGPADVYQAGGLSPYGTMAQGGNVIEWEETDLDLVNDSISNYRGSRGGDWDSLAFELSATARGGGLPHISFGGTGFRVGSIVPEPTVVSIIGVGLFAILALNEKRGQDSLIRSRNSHEFRYLSCAGCLLRRVPLLACPAVFRVPRALPVLRPPGPCVPPRPTARQLNSPAAKKCCGNASSNLLDSLPRRTSRPLVP